jgi:hypothetical protein
VTKRDRIILLVLLGAGLLAGAWFVVLAPQREEAQRLSTELTEQQQRLDRAQASADGARRAKAEYRSDLAQVARLGKAVPADDGVPSLISQIQAAAHGARISFNSITTSESGGATSAPAPTSTSGSSGSSGDATSGATAGGGPQPLTFQFAFEGSLLDLQRMLADVHRFVRPNGERVAVRGRLLRVDSIGLAANTAGKGSITATVSATAWTLPAAAAPAGAAAGTQGASGSAPAQPASTTTATVTGVTR